MARLVVIGGVAAGMSAASQAKRRRPDWEVVVLERGPDVSYGACGIPYNVLDPRRSIDDLVVVTALQSARSAGIDVRTRHEVLSLDPAGRRDSVRDLERGRDYELTYDALVIATGASRSPPLRAPTGLESSSSGSCQDGAALKAASARRRARRGP